MKTDPVLNKAYEQDVPVNAVPHSIIKERKGRLEEKPNFCHPSLLFLLTDERRLGKSQILLGDNL